MIHNGENSEEIKIVKDALFLIKKDELTMENLVSKSGLSRSHIYRIYGGKDEIIKLVSEKTNFSVSDSMDMKKKILTAARIVFAKKGFFRATMEEIAKQATVGTATVYRYFETKENLIQAFKDEYTPGIMIGSIEIDKDCNPEDVISLIIFKGLEFITNNRDLFRISFFEAEEGLEYYRTAFDQSNRTIPVFAEQFRKLIDSGKIRDNDPIILAYSLLGLIMGHGYIKPAYSGSISETLEENAKTITDIFLKGIGI